MDDQTAAPAEAPAYVFLLADWGSRVARSVLRGDPDLLSTLDVEGVKYRAASDLERGLAGFPA